MPARPADADFDALIAIVRDRLSRNMRIRRNLPGGGRLRLDRQLPFLCVYRTPPRAEGESPADQPRDRSAAELVTTEAAYLFASGEPEFAERLSQLCAAINEVLRDHLGSLLILELWSLDDGDDAAKSRTALRPGFRITASAEPTLASTVDALAEGLRAIKLHGLRADVEVIDDDQPGAPGLPSLSRQCAADGCLTIGIGVRPVYRNAATGELYPLVLQSLRRQLAVALRKGVFAFTGREKSQPLAHYEALGPSTIPKAARAVDQQLSEISQSFDFLLQVTPVNAEKAWEDFEASGYAKAPTLHYRPLPYHPSLLKRQLYSIPIEHVEDASLVQLFEQKQDELDKQLDALKHLGTRAFFYDSLHLYGSPDEDLVRLADSILDHTRAAADDIHENCVPADQVAAAAREHIDYYHQRLPDFQASVQVCDTIASALMVAQDRLFISERSSIRPQRLEPLLHHEVGTHLLTYFNGRQQPLRQLYAGFPGYEALQEGLAVLAEYLVGGLSVGRTRTLAARVLAVRSMLRGESFMETFELLHDEHHLGPRSAFMTALRVHRGGGLSKDAIYLRGLRDLLTYLREGHELEPLYVGKISLEEVRLVQELRRRGVIQPPALLPRFWDEPNYRARLALCRRLSLVELLEQLL
ncbi:hypothetical protein PLANPX_0759 [Lacipirellula parvula]|uniref:Flavohemoglobin expression-modulating QEGLA motif protein n=2 Tax=Lacipirellula parvula TaxID=2650471 RepID=A0A5K7X5N0_9BACT|nr:hypothetical protein PLANPX_0759 [Lacipirellula parvula]